jgi:Skp family chaperone for outer membrane proteins
MKKILLILLVFTSGLLNAQDDRHEKIKALKVALITEALDLSSSEAEKFWPVYNAYDEKMHSLRKNERKEIHRAYKKDLENMSEAEANALIDKVQDYKAKELAYRNELIKGLRKVISSNKIIQLSKAEEEFKRQLLERFKKGREKE